MKRVSLEVFLLSIIIMVMVGCGSVENTESIDKQQIIKKATFIDSFVKGARYNSGEGISGYTDSNGIFKYIEGKSVKFYAGNVFLGETYPVIKPSGVVASTDKIVTPLGFVNSNTIYNEQVIQIVKFLMLLDRDKNPDNGIDIDLGNPLLQKHIDVLDIDLNKEFGSGVPSYNVALKHIAKSLGIELKEVEGDDDKTTKSVNPTDSSKDTKEDKTKSNDNGSDKSNESDTVKSTNSDTNNTSSNSSEPNNSNSTTSSSNTSNGNQNSSNQTDTSKDQNLKENNQTISNKSSETNSNESNQTTQQSNESNQTIQSENSENNETSSNDGNQTTGLDDNKTASRDDNQTTQSEDNETSSNEDNQTTGSTPTITLNGDNHIYVILGNSYIELGAKAYDDEDGNLSVDINSSVNVAKLGSYSVTYSVTDSDGNSVSATREVEIIDPKILTKDLEIEDLSCKSWYSFEVPNSPSYYKINNNDWGRKYLDDNSDGIQCVFTYKDENGTKGGFYWGWPYNNDYQVKGYPEAIYGAKFKGLINPNSGFPALVSEIESVVVDIAYQDINFTRNYNIAFEFWLHDSQDTSMDNIKYEIMFRLDPDGFHPHNVWKEVSIDGIEFEVYKDADYGAERVFINFVAKNKITSLKLDVKKALDFLSQNSYIDIPTRYMSGIEMGVEVIDGSGMMLIDKMNVDLNFNINKIENGKLAEDFVAWTSRCDEDTYLDKEIDVNGTGWKWRALASNILLRKKNGNLVQKIDRAAFRYIYTMFDKSLDMSGESATLHIDGSVNDDYNPRLMLFDGNKWCMSSIIDGTYGTLKDMEFNNIEQSDELVSVFDNDPLPKNLDFNISSCDNFNLNTIKGYGLYYALKEGKDKGYFRLNSLTLYKELPKYGVYDNVVSQNSVSELLFGLCTTPNRGISQNETFIDNYKKWVAYLRWPGGSMIEDYDLRDHSEITYSVGKWTEFMQEKIPSMQFLIGVSSTRAYDGDWNATEYGYGLVNYLNNDYEDGWYKNEALSSPTNLKFVEIGNEPNLEGLNANKYGPVLVEYAKGIHEADASVKVVAPTTTHGEIGNMLPAVLKDYGDSIDIVSAHNYTDYPLVYKSDISLIKSYIQNYMRDNDRRKVSDIKIAFTEYNSLSPSTRKGVIHEESWAKIIWHGESFSYFIQGGLYMASLWHSFINGGHALYQRDGTPYPLVEGIQFWRDNIDFDKNPKVLYATSNDSKLIITPIEMDDKLVVFVVNSSPNDDKKVSLEFMSNQFGDEVKIKILTHTTLTEYYDQKDVADNVDVDNLKYLNPDAIVTTDDDGNYQVKFPKLDIDIVEDSTTLDNGVLEYTYPKYTITVLELKRK